MKKRSNQSQYTPLQSSKIREQKYLDFNDPAALTNLFKANPNKLSLDENYFLKQIRFRFSKQGNNELIDFSSTSLPQIRDGNTLFNGIFVRRGLPMFDESLQVPAKQNFELVSYLKTNGDCCMVTYLQKQNSFLIATRNVSVLVQNIAQANKIQNATHKIIAKIWFQFLDKKDKAFIKSLQNDLIGHTWIGELLTQENLMDYQQEQILFHSIVENQSGVVKADSKEFFNKYGFSCVPYKSYGQMDSLSLINKIESLKKETESMQISQTHEGIVLQLVDKEINRVHSSMKVKCLEYLLFKSMTEILQNSIERGEIDTQFDKNNLAYLKQHKDVIKVNKVLPNEEQIYLDIFNTALTLVSQRQNPNEFNQNRTSLLSERAQFYNKAISVYQEKKKKTISVDFKNQIDFPQEEPTLDVTEQITTKNSTRQRKKPKLIVVACPPFSLSMYCYEMLQEMFNLYTIDHIDQFELPKRNLDSNQPKRSNLLLIQNLDGIQEQTKYQITSLWVFNITIKSNKEIVKNSISEEQSYYSYSENLSTAKLRIECQDFKNQCEQLEMDVLMFDSEDQLLNSLNQQVEEEKLYNDFNKNNLPVESSSSKTQKSRESKLNIDRNLNYAEEFQDDQPTESQPVKTKRKSSLKQKNPTNDQKISKSIIFILLPLGLPGMGHLDFYQSQVEQSLQDIYPDLNIHIVSDRVIRQEQTSKYLDNNKKKTWIQSVKATERRVTAEFSQLLQRQIKECTESQGTNAIYLDRCFTPNSLQSILQSPLFVNTEFLVVKGVILVPDLPKKQTIQSNDLSIVTIKYYGNLQFQLLRYYFFSFSAKSKSVYIEKNQEGCFVCLQNSIQRFQIIGSESQLPKDLDNLMSEAIELSLDSQNQRDEFFYQLIDDIAQKIQMYRSLFGATDFSTPSKKNSSPYTKQFKSIFDKVIQEHEVKPTRKNITKLNKQYPQDNENLKFKSQTRLVNQNRREQYYSEDQYSEDSREYKKQSKKQKQSLNRSNQKLRGQNLFDYDQSSIQSIENGRNSNQKYQNKQEKQASISKKQKTNDVDQRRSVSQNRISSKQSNQYPAQTNLEQQRKKYQNDSPKRINQQNSIKNFKEQESKQQVRPKSLLKTKQVSNQREQSNSIEKQKKSVSFQQENMKQKQSRAKGGTVDQTEKVQVQQKIVKKYVAKASSINSEIRETMTEHPQFDDDENQAQINLMKVDAKKFYPSSSNEEKYDPNSVQNTKKSHIGVNDQQLQVSDSSNSQTNFNKNDQQEDFHLNRNEIEHKVLTKQNESDNSSQLDFDVEKEQLQQQVQVLSQENNFSDQRQDQPFKENPFTKKLTILSKESSEVNDDDIAPWQEQQIKNTTIQEKIQIQNESISNFDLDEEESNQHNDQQQLQSEIINTLQQINSTDLVDENNLQEGQLMETSSPIDDYFSIDNQTPDLFILQPIITKTEINQLLLASILKSDSKILKEMNEEEEEKKIYCDFKALLENQDGKLIELNGWQLNLDYRILIEYIGRDDYKLKESRSWQDGFNSGTKQITDIVGLVIIPNQMIICVGLPIKDTIEVPCMVLAYNRQLTDQANISKIITETFDMCEKTVQWRGSAFRDKIVQATKGNVIEQMVSRQKIKISSTSKTVKVIYVALENSVSLQYITQIIY